MFTSSFQLFGRARRLCFCASLLLVAACGLDGAAQAPQLQADKLFEPDHLVDVRIEISPADWESLRAQTRMFAEALSKKTAKSPFTYFKGHVTIDGVRIENVGIRKKGFLGSLDDYRPSLKIKFDEYTKQSPVKGIDRLTLNNNRQDAAQASQYLSYKLFNDAGIHASRCNFAKVSVNGKNLGIYSNVESIKPPFLAARFGDGGGALFEGTVADFHEGGVQKIEAKTKTAKIELLEPIVKILKSEGAVDLAALEKQIDIEAFVRFWAMESLIGFWDGYTNNQNNYFVYRNPKNSKWYFIPWGTDSSFTNSVPVPPYSVKNKSVHSQSLLANRLYRDPAIQKMYSRTFHELLKTHWDEKALNAELDRVEKLVKPHLSERQRGFDRGMKSMRSFVDRRRAVLKREIDKWPIKLTSGPRTPVYFKKTGTVSGSFSTVWHIKTPFRPSAVGDAKLKVELDGKVVEFRQLGVISEFGKFPGPGDEKPPTVVFVGNRKSDGKRLTLAISLSKEAFAPSSKPVSAQGVMFEGLFGFLNPKGMKFMAGQIQFEAAEIKKDAPVRGSVDLKVLRIVGGE